MNHGHLKNPKTVAFFETATVCIIYIVLSNLAVAKDIFGATQWFSGFSQIESNIPGGFTTGAITQIILIIVLISIPIFPDVRKAISTLIQPATSKGWRIALIILLIEVIVLYLGWIKDLDKLYDTSSFGISMSIVPSFDGLTQEIIFRGYLILRLARSGISAPWQIIISGILFAAIHIPYMAVPNQDFSLIVGASLIPLAGTFSLGAAWAFAFQQSGYKLMPVVASHILVIAIVQPWLALAYAIT